MSEERYPTDPDQGKPSGRSGAWQGPAIGGLVLIVLGIIFLGQTLNWFHVGNWWALFILIPAAFALGSAWSIYRAQGRVTREMSGPIIGGLIMLWTAIIFLANLPWDKVWPVYIVIIGLGMLVGWRR